MSKVGEYFIEMQELGLIQSPEPTEEEYNLVEEPTDDELAAIEADFEALDSWKDINWDQLLQTVTFYFKKSLVDILKNRYITM